MLAKAGVRRGYGDIIFDEEERQQGFLTLGVYCTAGRNTTGVLTQAARYLFRRNKIYTWHKESATHHAEGTRRQETPRSCGELQGGHLSKWYIRFTCPLSMRSYRLTLTGPLFPIGIEHLIYMKFFCYGSSNGY